VGPVLELPRFGIDLLAHGIEGAGQVAEFIAAGQVAGRKAVAPAVPGPGREGCDRAAEAVPENEGQVDGEDESYKDSHDEEEDAAFPTGKEARGKGAAEDEGTEEKDQYSETKEYGGDLPGKGDTGMTHGRSPRYPIPPPWRKWLRSWIMAFSPRFEYIVDRRDPMDAGTRPVSMYPLPRFMLFKELFNAAKLQ